jgi:hypothetical protein
MLVLSVSWMGLLMGGSTMTTIRLRAAVRIGGASVFFLPLSFAGLVDGMAAGKGGDIIKSAARTAVIYFIVSMSL